MCDGIDGHAQLGGNSTATVFFFSFFHVHNVFFPPLTIPNIISSLCSLCFICKMYHLIILLLFMRQNELFHLHRRGWTAAGHVLMTFSGFFLFFPPSSSCSNILWWGRSCFKVIALIIPPISMLESRCRHTIRQTPADCWALQTCRHVNSRGGINPWNEADDRFQFRATSKSVNAAALTGTLGVRDTGWGI